jgi:hypothetical protein
MNATADADMFTGTEHAPLQATVPAQGIDQGGPLIEFEGELVRNAEVRFKPAADGLHSVPVVCVELRSLVYGLHRTCHAEQAFTDATRHQAEALAKTLTRKKVITVRTPASAMHVSLPHAFLSLHQEH